MDTPDTPRLSSGSREYMFMAARQDKNARSGFTPTSIDDFERPKRAAPSRRSAAPKKSTVKKAKAPELGLKSSKRSKHSRGTGRVEARKLKNAAEDSDESDSSSSEEGARSKPTRHLQLVKGIRTTALLDAEILAPTPISSQVRPETKRRSKKIGKAKGAAGKAASAGAGRSVASTPSERRRNRKRRRTEVPNDQDRSLQGEQAEDNGSLQVSAAESPASSASSLMADQEGPQRTDSGQEAKRRRVGTSRGRERRSSKELVSSNGAKGGMQSPAPRQKQMHRHRQQPADGSSSPSLSPPPPGSQHGTNHRRDSPPVDGDSLMGSVSPPSSDGGERKHEEDEEDEDEDEEEEEDSARRARRKSYTSNGTKIASKGKHMNKHKAKAKGKLSKSSMLGHAVKRHRHQRHPHDQPHDQPPSPPTSGRGTPPAQALVPHQQAPAHALVKTAFDTVVDSAASSVGVLHTTLQALAQWRNRALSAEVRASSLQAKYDACLVELREARKHARRGRLLQQAAALEELIRTGPAERRARMAGPRGEGEEEGEEEEEKEEDEADMRVREDRSEEDVSMRTGAGGRGGLAASAPVVLGVEGTAGAIVRGEIRKRWGLPAVQSAATSDGNGSGKGKGESKEQEYRQGQWPRWAQELRDALRRDLAGIIAGEQEEGWEGEEEEEEGGGGDSSLGESAGTPGPSGGYGRHSTSSGRQAQAGGEEGQAHTRVTPAAASTARPRRPGAAPPSSSPSSSSSAQDTLPGGRRAGATGGTREQGLPETASEGGQFAVRDGDEMEYDGEEEEDDLNEDYDDDVDISAGDGSTLDAAGMGPPMSIEDLSAGGDQSEREWIKGRGDRRRRTMRLTHPFRDGEAPVEGARDPTSIPAAAGSASSAASSAPAEAGHVDPEPTVVSRPSSGPTELPPVPSEVFSSQSTDKQGQLTGMQSSGAAHGAPRAQLAAASERSSTSFMMLRGGYDGGKGAGEDNAVSRLVAVSGPPAHSVQREQQQEIGSRDGAEDSTSNGSSTKREQEDRQRNPAAGSLAATASMRLDGRTRRPMRQSTQSMQPGRALPLDKYSPVSRMAASAPAVPAGGEQRQQAGSLLSRGDLLELALEGGRAALEKARRGLQHEVRGAIRESMGDVKGEVQAVHSAAMQQLARHSARSLELLEDAADLRRELEGRSEAGTQTEVDEDEDEEEGKEKARAGGEGRGRHGGWPGVEEQQKQHQSQGEQVEEQQGSSRTDRTGHSAPSPVGASTGGAFASGALEEDENENEEVPVQELLQPATDDDELNADELLHRAALLRRALRTTQAEVHVVQQQQARSYHWCARVQIEGQAVVQENRELKQQLALLDEEAGDLRRQLAEARASEILRSDQEQERQQEEQQDENEAGVDAQAVAAGDKTKEGEDTDGARHKEALSAAELARREEDAAVSPSGKGGPARDRVLREQRLSEALADIEHVRAERDAFVALLASMASTVLTAPAQAAKPILWERCLAMMQDVGNRLRQGTPAKQAVPAAVFHRMIAVQRAPYGQVASALEEEPSDLQLSLRSHPSALPLESAGSTIAVCASICDVLAAARPDAAGSRGAADGLEQIAEGKDEDTEAHEARGGPDEPVDQLQDWGAAALGNDGTVGSDRGADGSHDEGAMPPPSRANSHAMAPNSQPDPLGANEQAELAAMVARAIDLVPSSAGEEDLGQGREEDKGQVELDE